MSALPSKADMSRAIRDAALGQKRTSAKLATRQKTTQPPGCAWQLLMQRSRSTSQLRLTGNRLELVDKQLPPQSCKQTLNKFWQLTEQPTDSCAIFFFGMGVKSPAKLGAIKQKRIIAAAPLIFIWTPP